MEIVDELMTPGCPNCAVKHLSSYLSSIVDNRDVGTDSPVPLYCARALINLVEAEEGYKSHLHFAVGLIAMAEQYAIVNGSRTLAEILRTVRTDVMIGEITKACGALMSLSGNSIAIGHLVEAGRELPEILLYKPELISTEFDKRVTQEYVEYIVDTIKWIRDTYFPVPDKPEKGGDDTMACAKKAKATKAACKGGKCGGKKCK